jgi:hypothetical protein
MAFINPNNSGVIAFAEYTDVTATDQRVFEANEGIADSTMVEDLTEKATSRILQLIRNTDWWKRYYLVEASEQQRTATQTRNGFVDAPLPDADLILRRQADFTDLCVYFTLYEYLLPKVADFSTEDNAEVRKIGFYRTKFDELFRELIGDGTWYDFDASGTVTRDEKMPTNTNLVRIR